MTLSYKRLGHFKTVQSFEKIHSMAEKVAGDIKETIEMNEHIKKTKLQREASRALATTKPRGKKTSQEQPQQGPSSSVNQQPGTSKGIGRPKFPPSTIHKNAIESIFDLQSDEDFEFVADED